MNQGRPGRRLAAAWIPLLLLATGAGASVIATSPAAAATTGPCDIYASGGTPCVAAHSTTRALYGSYTGYLYQVRRASDNTYRSITPLTAGGVADASIQDSFCANTTCVISRIYDQSGRGNDLTQAPPGGFSGPAAGGYDNLANATAAPISVGGHKAYGVYVSPGTGYRNNSTNGVATGDQPEGMYAIFDGTHYNGGCCFDYGNAETNSRDNGNGTMEAIYFGNIKVWGYGSGNGPWIMADLENGLFSGVNTRYNANDPTINYRFTTAIIKGEPNHWAIRGGNAQSGSLSTFYNGVRPNASGYNPMKKEGAIILGIGGDNSIGAAGTFYEGVMTSGYPTDATENSVQANINAAGYSTSTSTGSGQHIRGTGSGRCIDVPNGSGTNGAQVQLYDCWNTSGQLWTYTSGKQLQVLGNKCLDAYGQGTANGTQVVIWDCNGQANQQWNVNSNGSISGVQSGRCLDAVGAGTANGTKIQLYACSGGSNQQWSLQ
ncbi:arabinofuranosidase catalytic domain-containing protein [Plantactinospora sp. KBS50]|uniref:arabinofuranosidase catalytic domain-containing protein n=1 Tax=Plantactinospora sp. KBS50 TaxID=2024580 RepID=UPI000BAADE5A|nr:arabinofuranosidase catalytic domain-containing protein [Plantactinospora sp. KBS50]ASW55200.1 alpha-L-arabinofuranosidase [Plantactinospora sp. KBS50]